MSTITSLLPLSDVDKAKFMDRIRKDGPIPQHCPELGACWLWTGAHNAKGYGVFKVGTRRPVRAHRMSFVVSGKELPPEKPLVCHHCDTPGCCNPDHLFAGTNDDNMRDRDEKGRGAAGENHYTHTRPSRIPRGTKRARAKLTEAVIPHIRKLYAERSLNGMSQQSIAALYGVSQMVISKVVRGKTWIHA